MAIQDDLPRSRITLTYRTTISGQPEDVNLPFRLLMLGDFSGGTSTDRQLDLDVRAPRSLDGKNLDELMKDMQMSLSVTVPNRVNPDDSADLDIKIPIDSMKSFHPDSIVEQVPKLKALYLLRTLILEMQSQVDNRKDLRRALYDLFAKPDALKGMRDELKAFQTLQLPAAAAAAPAGNAPAQAGNAPAQPGNAPAQAGNAPAQPGNAPAPTPPTK
jgi:type VI secretion system protein ImpB